MNTTSGIWANQEIERLQAESSRLDDVITNVKHDLMLVNKQAASMSNTLGDYAGIINSLAHYIIDKPTSNTQEAKDYANEALDFIVPYLESG